MGGQEMKDPYAYIVPREIWDTLTMEEKIDYCVQSAIILLEKEPVEKKEVKKKEDDNRRLTIFDI